MKQQKIHMPNLSYIAAFVIGVLLFASFWKIFFDTASNAIVLAGMAGVAVAITFFWIRNEIQHHKQKEK